MDVDLDPSGGSSGESNNNEQSLYIFGNDEDFVDSVKNSKFQGNQLLPLSLEAVKLKAHAMTDKCFGPRSRAFFLLEILAEAFSNKETIEQILSGPGFNDMLSAPESLKYF